MSQEARHLHVEQHPFAEFAAYLAEFKEERGLSQSDIARALEVAPSQPSGWSSGRSRPRPENLERMAEVYGLDLDALLKLCRYRTRSTNGKADPDETEVLALYRQLADEHRPTVKSILRGLTGMRGPARVTKRRDGFGRAKVEEVHTNQPRHRPYRSQSLASMKAEFGFQPA